MTPLLSVEQLDVAYGRIAAVRGASLTVAEGEIVALLGANGAGKTSTLNAITGTVRASGGCVRFDGAEIQRLAPEAIVRRGVAITREGRHVFANMTVAENLELGAITVKDRAWTRTLRAELLERFPRLAERAGQLAGSLSGGEQQQLVLVRALLSRPRLLLLDEPSLGLAPLYVDSVLALVAELPARGIAVLLVEQNTHEALAIADRAYVMSHGEIVRSGPADELGGPEIERAYLGLGTVAA